LVIDAGQEALLRLRVFADEYATGDIFTVLQATWALVLGTHMGIDDVTFAVILRDTCSSVDRRQTVVGRMDITFPTHARVDRGVPLVALFESLKHAQYQGEQHGYIGFDRILEQWDVSRPSIFSALRICGRGSHPTAPRLASEDGAFPLSLRFGILNSLRLDASFHSSLGEEHIHVLLDHFVAALNSLLSLNAFAAKAGDISLLSSAERAKVVDQAAPRAPMRRELIHRLIEARAAASPQAVAIEELEPWRAWTIGELNRFSNIVARNLGGYRKAVIPVCLDRSAYLVIALLAILKTGSAYGMLGFDVFLV
jgi:non-ribosomal peptide synthetase component F